jgi:hypothetical protein
MNYIIYIYILYSFEFERAFPDIESESLETADTDTATSTAPSSTIEWRAQQGLAKQCLCILFGHQNLLLSCVPMRRGALQVLICYGTPGRR